MFRKIFILMLLAFITVHPQTKSKIEFTPAKPQIGDSLTIIFYPGESSPVLKADSLYLNMLYLYVTEGYKADEYLMKKKDNYWRVTFELVNEKIGCIALQFATPDFSKIDCVDDKGWDILIYDKNGEPVKGAYMAYADGYITHGLIRRMQDKDKYKNGLEEEFRRYPEDPINLLKVLNYIPKEERKRKLDSLVARYEDNKKVLSYAEYEYLSLEDSVKAAEVNVKLKALDPRQTEDIWRKRAEIFFKPAGPEKASALEELQRISEGTSAHSTIQRDYFQTLVQANLFDRAIKFIPQWKRPDPEEILLLPVMMITKCKTILKKKQNVELATYIPLREEQDRMNEIVKNAFEITRAGIDVFNGIDNSTMPVDFTPSIWSANKKRFIGLSTFYLGEASLLIGNEDDAIKHFESAKSIMGKNFYFMRLDNYFALLLKRKENNKAFHEAVKCINNSSLSVGFLEKVLKAAASTPDKEKEAERIIAGKKGLIEMEREREIKSNYLKSPQEAIDFTLEDLAGKEWVLSALKGKIVVLEFWDTYCGWCEKNLALLNNFYLKHKNDKDLVFLAINVDPGEDNKTKYENVSSYMKRYKYSFPVLLDYNNNVIAKYKLYGIPQTIVIGKEGKIRYKEAGYAGDTLVKDLEGIIKSLY